MTKKGKMQEGRQAEGDAAPSVLEATAFDTPVSLAEINAKLDLLLAAQGIVYERGGDENAAH